MRATHPSYITRHEMIILMIFGDEYRL
jgi:hypothetical protein